MSPTHALITGASSGIGRGLALALARAGVKVRLVARRLPLLEELAREIHAGGGRAEVYALDVGDAAATEALVRGLDDEEPLDLVVANAGIGPATPGDALDWKTLDAVLRVDFMGAIATLAGALPAMVRRGAGHLVAISSLAGYRGLPRLAGYCAAKAGLNTFMESLRVDLRGSGVAVTTVCPGVVRTEMAEKNLAQRRDLFVVELDEAVRRIMAAIAGRVDRCAFPRPVALPMSLVHHLPSGVYNLVAAGIKPFVP